MKKYRRQLPPLDALIFFEAAARLNSFTKAAEELYVTQAAVSKRIRELESRLGAQLFRRHGRQLSITEIGQRLYQRTGMALEYLTDACRLAESEEPETIYLAANSAISLFWLTPQIKTFGLSKHSTNINLFTSDTPGDIINPKNDLVISYGYGQIPGWNSTPAYIDKLRLDDLGDLARNNELYQTITLLEYGQFAPDWINWQTWIEQTNSAALEACQLKLCRTYAQAIGAAKKSQGLALGSRRLIDEELEKDELRVVSNVELISGRAYYVSHPKKKILSPATKMFRQQLLSTVLI
jgi:LysR family glycine cleavage system transcriptional activator